MVYEIECHSPGRFAVSCLQSVVFPVPDGAEIMNRMPRLSVEDRGWPEAGAVELVAVTEFIRRFGPVRECVLIQLSSVPHAR